MKVLFSSNKNPHFFTITEYIEEAFQELGHKIYYFDNRCHFIPGRIRYRIPLLNRLDLRRLNQQLIRRVEDVQPDIFLEEGGHRVFPETIERIKECGVKTILWTIDHPRGFEPVEKAALYYDYVFTGGSEAYDILKEVGIMNLHWLPFACDPKYHRPLKVSEDENKEYGCDICFVGSYYPVRETLFSVLSDYDFNIWGPGWDKLSQDSPLSKCIKGLHVKPEEWLKIYSVSKIVLSVHYQDPEGKIPCHQASPRVYEALASGAFLMTDKQRDVLRLFQSGRDLVVFENREDLKKLVSFYLNQPQERKSISRKGREEVLKKHTYKHRIEEMLGVINLR